jgi:hypothetical protein
MDRSQFSTECARESQLKQRNLILKTSSKLTYPLQNSYPFAKTNTLVIVTNMTKNDRPITPKHAKDIALLQHGSTGSGSTAAGRTFSTVGTGKMISLGGSCILNFDEGRNLFYLYNCRQKKWPFSNIFDDQIKLAPPFDALEL